MTKRGATLIPRVFEGNVEARCGDLHHSGRCRSQEPTLELTELDAKRDAVPLLEAMVRYAQAEGPLVDPALELPGKPA